MTAVEIQRIAAFADATHAGNPAGVCLLDDWSPWPDDAVLLRIAAAVGLSETAFLRGRALRWFTPAVEMPLCGHATLATAFVLGEAHVAFETREAGVLTADIDGADVTMDFPAHPPTPRAIDDAMIAALGARPDAAFDGFKGLVRFGSEAEVAALEPDFERMAALDVNGVIATAPGRDVDFVSRFFAPKLGVPEDPVTGSAHTVLAPYWAQALGRDDVVGRQIPRDPPPEGGLAWEDVAPMSARPGGVVRCTVRGERVVMRGSARRTGRGRVVG
ncbi:MAG: PhzF family phenazine biosynthesis protein [Deltaproteobacteria bacterium]|jgi:predicted PhzF superfamily epimerase YddE/YHI9